MNEEQEAVKRQIESLRALRKEKATDSGDRRKDFFTKARKERRVGQAVCQQAVAAFPENHPVHAWAKLSLWRDFTVRIITLKNRDLQHLEQMKERGFDPEKIEAREAWLSCFSEDVEMLKEHVVMLEGVMTQVRKDTEDSFDWSLLDR